MNKKGQQLWEFTILLAVLFGAYVWFTSSQKTISNEFHKGSQQLSPSAESKPLFSLINFTFVSTKSGTDDKQKVSTKSDGVKSQVVVAPVQPTEPPNNFSLSQALGISEEKLSSIGHLSPTERFCVDGIVIFVVIIVGGLLDALGGFHWLFCRRYIMPALIAAGISTIVYGFNPVWYSWLAGLLVTPAMGTLCLGYPGVGNNFERALWLFIQSVVLGLFLVLTSYFFHIHLLAWYFYLWYVISTGVWGGLYKNWQQFKGDWITGGWLCSLILYVFLSQLFNL